MINVESLQYDSVLKKKLSNKFLYNLASIILRIFAYVLEANFDRRVCHASGLFEMLYAHLPMRIFCFSYGHVFSLSFA